MEIDRNGEIDLSAIQEMFRLESTEMLLAAEQALLILEKDPTRKDLVETIFRCAHSIKGSARVVGYNSIGDFVHGFEDLMSLIREGELEIKSELISYILQFVDAMKMLIPATKNGAPTPDVAQQALLVRLKEFTSETPTEGNTDGSRDTEANQNSATHAPPTTAALRSQTIRVPVERLDQLMNLVGEIAIARGQVTDLLESSGETDRKHLLETHREADLLHMDLQELAMKLRTVPIGPLFEEFHRPVRDLALACDKQARLVIEGEGAEVDTSVVQHLRDPLTHMVRNAVYHGLESPGDRMIAGKNPIGTIRLAASREAGRIRLVVSDDGAGLDRDRILETARKRNLLPDGKVPDDNELFQLIFNPGFSTAKDTNQISGRGVGLDVVQQNLESLRGRVRVETRLGEGTTFILTMPLTLSIINGFRVKVGEETYVIPLESVIECVELPADDKERKDRFGVTRLRGKPLPFLYLGRMFAQSSSRFARENLLVIRYGDKQAGIVVDQLLGEAQTVIKPLGKLFQDIVGLTGSTIMGNGKVAFVLDVAALVITALQEMENTAKKAG